MEQASVLAPRRPQTSGAAATMRPSPLRALGVPCTPGQARVPERLFLRPALSELGGPRRFSATSPVTAVSRAPRAAGPTAPVRAYLKAGSGGNEGVSRSPLQFPQPFPASW